MMNGSKPCGLPGGFQAPSPKRRRPRLRVSCSPSPQPSPSGRGRALARCWKIRTSRLQSPLFCLSFRSHTTTKLGRITKVRANVSPSPGGEPVGVRGNEANSNPRRTMTPGAVKLRGSPAEPVVSQFDINKISDLRSVARPCDKSNSVRQ